MIKKKIQESEHALTHQDSHTTHLIRAVRDETGINFGVLQIRVFLLVPLYGLRPRRQQTHERRF